LQIEEQIKKLDSASDWSMTKGNTGVHVMVDSENCFVCPSVKEAVAAYNFCKVHTTLGTTPAHGIGLTTEPWTIEKLIEEATI